MTNTSEITTTLELSMTAVRRLRNKVAEANSIQGEFLERAKDMSKLTALGSSRLTRFVERSAIFMKYAEELENAVFWRRARGLLDAHATAASIGSEYAALDADLTTDLAKFIIKLSILRQEITYRLMTEDDDSAGTREGMRDFIEAINSLDGAHTNAWASKHAS